MLKHFELPHHYLPGFRGVGRGETLGGGVSGKRANGKWTWVGAVLELPEKDWGGQSTLQTTSSLIGRVQPPQPP